MEITFESEKMRDVCNSERKMVAKYNRRLAEKLKQRLKELEAADTLDDLSPDKLPQARCHELDHDRRGQLGVTLFDNRRLVFRPVPPVPKKPDGGLDWKQVMAIEVIEVVDYHPAKRAR